MSTDTEPSRGSIPPEERVLRFLDVVGKTDELPATDDVLARVLPLLEQVALVHEAGRVAPLEGVEALSSLSGRLFFAGDAARDPRRADAAIARMRPDERAAVEVRGRFKKDDDEGAIDLSVGSLETAIVRPVYLPRFVAWEHTLEHHDPLTDVFVLGLVMASVALDCDLGDETALRTFVAQRRTLTRLNPRLHPVVARVIASMTELDRHARTQDLSSAIASLKSHREQRIDLDLRTADAGVPRRTGILRRLRDRLFDFSRRNRMLYFRPTGSTVDLTASSVPLVLDVKNVDASTLFTFRGKPAADVLSQKPLPLSRYLRFEDYPFVAPALDALRLEARRSRAELGFSQLRLVVCFLHWHDLKEAPEERITSPLLLLPAELDKKRGVRDAFTLVATDDRAEVNPVLRQYLRQRYGIELPEHVELSEEGAIDALHAKLVASIQATEPGVTVEKQDRPRIDLVVAVARRKLDAYRKKVKLSGRNARSRLGLDYAYRGPTLRPLGVQLFHAFVAPRAAPESVMHDPPRPIVWRAQPEGDTVTKELYSLKNAAHEGGPYRWSLDLTSCTLAHFNYQNVSLVRDYATLLEDERGAPNPAFSAIFRDDARPIDDDVTPLPLPERHEVVLADPTQSTAVARARTGASYVIQGPPGTGKSQTITNLVADYVARGKRVLFVCEKRAALDVVHHRLVQVGIGPLACIIHDAQEDKKDFLKDLKETYEGWLAVGVTREARERRKAALDRARGLVERGTRIESAMKSHPDGSDASLLDLLRRAVVLRDAVADVGDAPLPTHRATIAATEAIDRVESSLRALGHEGVLGRHPARLLGAPMWERAQTVDDMKARLVELERDLGRIAQHEALVRGSESALRLRDVIARHALALRVRPLVKAGLAALLDAGSDLSRRYRTAVAEVSERELAKNDALAASPGWRDPLPEADAKSALQLAKRYEAGFVARLLRWLSPGWWRLRGVLHTRFDVSSRAVLGDWSEILDGLVSRHTAEGAWRAAEARLRGELGTGDPREVRELVASLEASDAIPSAALPFRDALAKHGAETTLRGSIDAAAETSTLGERLALLSGWDDLDADRLRAELTSLARDSLALSPLRGPLVELDRSDAAVVAFLRTHPIDGRGLEASVTRRAITRTLRERAPDLAIAEGSVDALGEAMMEAASELRAASAEALVETVRTRFVERAQLATAPAAGLNAEQKELKRSYAAGRRDLEHELAKVMRHKTIREIVSGPAGAVVRDMKPIWLMSPLSVADVLPLAASFDLVVFDEASQIPLEDAVPAIHRGTQCIVVGDRQQLPPTNFFASASGDEETEEDELAGALDRELDADSLLTHADRTLPSTLLGWHYRSRDESLIAFSNRAFYAGRLLTVPPVAEMGRREPIVARDPRVGAEGCDRMLERPISFHRIAEGVYEGRRNVAEARYIAHLVRAFLAKRTGRTIGIVAFSEAQQGAIESALAELSEDDPDLRTRLEEEMSREEEGQHVGMFVKNLENVQGDERDVIIVSVCYGPDPRGRMIMNFGPINRKGGERRLNVIFSRAKHHIALVSTIGWERITNEYNDGASCLKTYLRYAEACSIGDAAGASAALLGTGTREARSDHEARDVVVDDVAAALRERGWEVRTAVGASRLRCDLAIRRPGEERARLAVLVDRPEHYALGVDEALRLKPGVLRAFGWRTTTLLTKDWLADRDAAVRTIESAATA